MPTSPDKPYHFEGDSLILTVKKGPVLLRAFLFLLGTATFLAPWVMLVLFLMDGQDIQGRFLFFALVFEVFAVYLLGMVLWNTYGREIISVDKGMISYVADYGWFKDRGKKRSFPLPIPLSSRDLGAGKANLIIGEGNARLLCVTRMSEEEVEELIELLRKLSATPGSPWQSLMDAPADEG